MCNATPDIIDSTSTFVRLFRHECDRIFGDRLTTADDQKVYSVELNAVIKENFPDCVEYASKDPCIFGDFENAVDRISSGGEAEDVRLYKDMGNSKDYTIDHLLFG